MKCMNTTCKSLSSHTPQSTNTWLTTKVLSIANFWLTILSAMLLFVQINEVHEHYLQVTLVYRSSYSNVFSGQIKQTKQKSLQIIPTICQHLIIPSHMNKYKKDPCEITEKIISLADGN